MKKMNRKHRYLHTTIARQRLCRDDKESGGGTGNESGAGGNNTGGNSQTQSNGGSNQNNDGQQFDANRFWADPQQQERENQNRNDGNGNDGQQDDEGVNFGREIMGEITRFNAESLFTNDVAQQIADGNFEGVNKTFSEAVQNAVKQSVVLSAKIMQRFEQSLEAKIDQLVNSRMTQSRTQDQDEKLLQENFTGFAKPAMQPVIRGVFNQALRHSNGDRSKAMDLTKSMLREMGQIGREDLGIREPARGPDDFMSEGPSSLVDELLAMK